MLKNYLYKTQKQNKSPNSLYENIKMAINIAINFGQYPYQLLNQLHPIKNINIDVSSNSIDDLIFNDNNNSRYNSVFSDKSNKENKIIINQKVDDIYKIKGGGEILYFGKS